jgi:hypothetical protein
MFLLINNYNSNFNKFPDVDQFYYYNHNRNNFLGDWKINQQEIYDMSLFERLLVGSAWVGGGVGMLAGAVGLPIFLFGYLPFQLVKFVYNKYQDKKDDKKSDNKNKSDDDKNSDDNKKIIAVNN